MISLFKLCVKRAHFDIFVLVLYIKCISPKSVMYISMGFFIWVKSTIKKCVTLTSVNCHTQINNYIYTTRTQTTRMEISNKS